MADLAIQQTTLDGSSVALAAATAGGDTFTNTGREVLIVNNGDASATTVTVDAVHLCNMGFDHNAVVSVAAGARVEIGPFPIERFGSKPNITYSKVTSLTVAVVKR